MSYRSPDRLRMMQQQQAYHFAAHSHTMTWQRTVSASGGVDVAGIGATTYSVSTPISALLKPLPTQSEGQTPAGMVAGALFQVVTHEPIGRDDKLTWNGVVYRVEADPIQSTLTDTWISIVTRENP